MMSFDEPAINSQWLEISLGSDSEQELRGRLQFRGGSRSVSESESIGSNGENAQNHISKQSAEKCEEDQDGTTKRPDDSYAYKLGMMFVNGAAKVVNNVADGGKQNRDTIKQLRAELDDSRLKCDEFERDVGKAKQWIAYYESVNGSLGNQMDEDNQKFSLERQSMQEKLLKSEEEAEFSRKALAEVTKMKDAMELKADETKKTVTRMKQQIEEAQKKISEYQENIVSSKAPVHLNTTSTQVEGIKLSETCSILTGELSKKLEDKEAQLEDATRSLRKLMKSEKEAECSRKTLLDVTKMKDALELDAEKTKKTVTKMKNQIEEAQKKISEYQENVVSSKAPVHLTTTSTQVENIELPEASSILARELSQKLKDKEAQLQDATRALHISFSHGDKLRHHLLTSSRSMKSQTIEMKRYSTALESAMKESCTLKQRLEEESLKRKGVEEELTEQQKMRDEESVRLGDTKKLLEQVQNELEQERISVDEKLKLSQSLVYEIKLNGLAEVLASSVIHDALEMQQTEFLLRDYKALEDHSNMLSQRLQVSEYSTNRLQEDIVSLQSQICNRDAGLGECNETIKTLLLEIEQLKMDIDTKYNTEIKLKESLEIAEKKLSQIYPKNEEDIKKKQNEISSLHFQVQLLQNKNVQLQQQVNQFSIKPIAASTSMQTDIGGMDITKMAAEAAVAEKKEKVCIQQTSSANERAEEIWQVNSNQRSQIANLENEIEELRHENSRLNCAVQEDQKRLYANNQSLWQTHEACRRIDWHCRQQDWMIKNLQQENLDLRRYIEKYSSYTSASTNQFQHGSNWTSTQHQQQPYYYDDKYNVILQEQSTNGTALETIQESDERASTSASTGSIKENLSSSLPDTNKSTPQEQSTSTKQIPETIKVDSSIGDTPTNCEDNRDIHMHVAKNIKRNDGHSRKLSPSLDLKASNFASEDAGQPSLDDEVFPNLKSHQRLIGIPMPQQVYDRILAGENVPSWKGEVPFSQDDGYSSSSCNSIHDEMRSQPVVIAESADSAISEIMHSNLTDDEVDDTGERQYYVSYKDIQFDMATLSLPQIRNIASASGAIATQSGMNNFYDFLAKQIEEMDKNPHWRGVHKLGSPSAWLSLKKEE